MPALGTFLEPAGSNNHGGSMVNGARLLIWGTKFNPTYSAGRVYPPGGRNYSTDFHYGNFFAAFSSFPHAAFEVSTKKCDKYSALSCPQKVNFHF